MTDRGSELQPTQPPPRIRPWTWVAFGAIAVTLVAFSAIVLGIGTGLFHPHDGLGVPKFLALAEHPDGSLHGTVAYYANDTGCVRIVAAAGRPSKNALCISKEDLAVKPQQGLKPAGPQLVWLPDDRLEVTMFVWSALSSGPPDYKAGWQKIVDVRSGKVRDVPATRVPSTPNMNTEPIANPRGERVGYSFDAMSGRVQVTLTDSTGTTRTLLSAHGPGEYTYSFGPVFWAPNWQWIAAGDTDRILVITPGAPSVTRVLVTRSGGGAGGGTAGPAFAVTGADLLGPAR